MLPVNRILLSWCVLGISVQSVHKIPPKILRRARKIFPVYIGEVLRRGTQNPSYIYIYDGFLYIGEVLRRGTPNPSCIYGQASWRRGTLFITMLAYIYRRGFTYGVRKISPIYTGVNFKYCISIFTHCNRWKSTVFTHACPYPLRFHSETMFVWRPSEVLVLKLSWMQ